MRDSDFYADMLNKFRVFPRAALIFLLWLAYDAYIYVKPMVTPESAEMFTLAVLAPVIAGLIAYMSTGAGGRGGTK